MLASETPNPGSPEAVRAGCTCAIFDNSHGRGRYGDGEKYGWWITEGCPLHGRAVAAAIRAGGGDAGE